MRASTRWVNIALTPQDDYPKVRLVGDSHRKGSGAPQTLVLEGKERYTTPNETDGKSDNG